MAIRTGVPNKPEDVQRRLEETFAQQGLGQHDVQVRRHSIYEGNSWKTQPGEFEVSIAHGKVKDDKWWGVVRMGENNTLEIRSGTGWQVMIGDTLDVGDKGIGTGKADAYATVPYYTGIESFARRVAGAFGLKAENLRVGGSDRFGKKVNSLFTEINANTNPAGGSYVTADEVEIPNHIPASNVRISQETSPVQRRYLSHMFNVPLIGQAQEALKNFSEQLKFNPAVLRETAEKAGNAALQGWALLSGGEVWKPDKNEANVNAGSGGLLITPSAAGTPFQEEMKSQPGMVQGAVAGLTEKFMKQSYTAGRRDINRFVVNTGKRLLELTTPEEAERAQAAGRTDVLGSKAVAQTSLVMRTGEEGYQGMRVRALTSLGALPWQSGQMQFTLPEDVRQQVTGAAEGSPTGERGGVLEAGYVGRRKFELQGVENIQQLLDEKWQVDRGIVGRVQPQGARVSFGSWENPRVKVQETDEEGNIREVNAKDPMTFTTGQQNMAVRDYTMYLPAAWGDTDEKRMAMGEQLRALSKRGVRVDWHAGDMVTLDVGLMSATPGGIKGASAKGSIDVPFVGGVARQLTGAQGVNQQSMGYNNLQNAKNVDAVMLNALQALPKTGENNVFDFLHTVYRGDAERQAAIGAAQSSVAGDEEAFDLQSLAQAMDYAAPEHMLHDVTSRALQYRPDREGKLAPTPLAEMDQDFNNELYERFGIGRVRGRVPVEQYRAEDIPAFRESWIQAQMAGQFDKETHKQVVAPMDRRAAEQLFAERVRPNLELTKLDDNRSIYTLYHEGEFLAHPKLATMVAEPSGVGTDQGDIYNALKAQKLGSLSEWYAENYSRMFRSTPARSAIQAITGSYLQTREAAQGLPPMAANTITIGKGGIDPEELQQVVGMRLGQEQNANPIDRLRIWESAMRELGGLGEDVKVDRLYMPEQQMVLAGPRHWTAVESEREAIAAEGGLEKVPQAHATTRFLRGLEKAVSSEALGEADLINREEMLSLQGQYINSDQMRKATGTGIFGRYGVSPLVRPGHVDLSAQGLSRMYQLGGGNLRNQREWRQFLRTAQGTPAMVFRQPGPNTGTDEAPGSYQTMLMQTPLSQGGRMINEAYEQAGLRRPDILLPQSLVATLGDADYDPSSVFPMMYRRQRRTPIERLSPERRARVKPDEIQGMTVATGNEWVAYRPEAYGEDYKKFSRELMRRASPQVQRNTFERIFGALGSSFNPLDENMRLSIQSTLGNRGTALLDERLALSLKNVQKRVQDWNAVKQVQMGATYNDYIRRPQAALTALGAPSEFLPQVRDSGVYWYQQAIDFTKVFSQWQGLMNTAGFFAKPGGQVQWGWNMAQEGDPQWAMDQWAPTNRESNSRSLVNILGGQIAAIPDARPEWAAGMLMNIPNRPEGIDDEDWSKQLRERQVALTRELEPLMANIPGEKPDSRNIRIRRGIARLASGDNPLIGEDSAAVYSTMARSFEYVQRDPQRWQEFSNQIDAQGGFNWKGKSLSAAEAAQMFKPVSMLHEFSLNKPGKDSWMSILEMSDLFVRARQGGYAGSQLIQEMWKSYGQSVGLNNPLSAAPNPLDPTTGKPQEITDLEQLKTLRGAYEENTRKMTEAYYSGRGGGIRNLSFSSIGAEAEIVESGSPYEDSYRRALSAGAIYGWRNPALRAMGGNVSITAPQQLVGGRGSNALFLQQGRATATGNDVEAEAARIIGHSKPLMERFGSHIGQMPGGHEPRYQVADEEGRQYRIAGIPDFLRLKENEPGKWQVDVYDWKNLPSQQGKSHEDVAEYVQGIVAYGTQIPGYGQMYSQPERITDEEFRYFQEALPNRAEREKWQRFRQQGQEGTRTAPVRARTFALASTFGTSTTPKERVGKLRAGLQALERGEETPDITMVPMSDKEMTLEEIASGDVTLAQTASKAVQLGQMTSLDAARYQLYTMKQYANQNPELRRQFMMGDTLLQPTAEEEAAKERWFSSVRREGETIYTNQGWEYNPAREEDFAEVYNKLQRQVSTATGGAVPPEPLGYAPGAREAQARQAVMRQSGETALPQRARGTAAPTPMGEVEPGASRPAPVTYEQGMSQQAFLQAIAGSQAAGITALGQQIREGGMGGSGGRFFGGKRFGPTQANEWLSKARMVADEMLGRFVPGENGEEVFQPGQFLQTYQELPEHFANMFPEEQRADILRVRDEQGASQAIKRAQTLSLSTGTDIRSAFRTGKWRTFMNQYKAFSFVGGNLQSNLGAVDQEELANWSGGREIIEALAMRGKGEQTLTDVSRPMAVLSELTGAIKFQSGGTSRKDDIPLAPEQRASTVESTREFFRIRQELNGITEGFFRVGPGLSKFASHFKDLDDAIQKADRGGEKWKAAAGHLNEMFEGRDKLLDRAIEVRREFGREGGSGYLKDSELQEMSLAAGNQRQRNILRQYEHETLQQGEREQRVAGILTGKGPEAPNIGRFARSLLGGFGMMYAKSIFNIASEPMQFGYGEYGQQQGILQNASLAQFGAGIGQVDPTAYNQRINASYGGQGWAALQRARADLYANNQAAGQAVNLLSAGAGGAGALMTAGMWLGAPTGAMLPFLAPAAIATAGLAGIGQVWGAAKEPDRNLTNVMGQIMRENVQYRPDGGGTWGATDPFLDKAGKIGTFFNFPLSGVQQARGVQIPMLEQLEALRKYEQGGGGDLRGFLEKQGQSPEQTNRLMGIYTGAQVSLLPQYETGAITTAAGIRDAYGISATVGAGGQGGLDVLSGWVQGGIPIEKLARQMAYSPNMTVSEQRDRAGQIMQNLIARQEQGDALTAEEAERMQTGAERWAALGAFQPSGLRVEAGTPGRYETQYGVTPTEEVRRVGPGLFDFKKVQVMSPTMEQVYVPGTPGIDEVADYQSRLEGLNETQFKAMMSRQQVEVEKAMLGLDYKMPELSEFEGEWDQKRTIEEMRKAESDQYRTQLLRNYRQTMLGFGVPVQTQELEDISNLEVMQRTQRLQQGYSFGMQMTEGGTSAQTASTIGLALGSMPAQQSYRYQQMLQFNPIEIGRYALANPQRWAQMPITMPGAGGIEIPTAYMAMTDYTETMREVEPGERRGFQEPGAVRQELKMTGMNWGTTSLALPGITSRQQAGNIWGQGWQQRTDLSQGLVEALIAGGSWGGQQFQINQQAQMQQEQAALNLRSMELNRTFQTGIGLGQYTGTINPQTGQPFGISTGSFGFSAMGKSYQSEGGGFWGIEDASRQLGYAQSEWQMDFNRRQLQMQDRQWSQDMALNRRTALTQRGFTAENWQYQDRMRGMQWGWQVEDFQEEKRFLTGRDRRLAERQQRRATVVHEEEGEQIDRQREQQKEMWKLEDARFSLQKRHHAEQVRMQEENQRATREFYEARKGLEDEQHKLARAYQMEQMKLQEQQAALSQKHAEITRQNQQTMLELSQFSELASSQGRLLNPDTMATLAETLIELDPAFASFVDNMDRLRSSLPGTTTSGSNGSRASSPVVAPRAAGGPVGAGIDYAINEREPEFFRPNQSGEIIPLSKLDPWQSETRVTPTSEKPGRTTVAIYIGNQHFRDVIVDTVEKEIHI